MKSNKNINQQILKKVIRVFWITFFCFGTEFSFGQFYWTPEITNAYTALSDLNIPKAKEELQKTPSKDNGLWYYTLQYALIVEIASNENGKLYDKLSDSLDILLERVKDLNPNSPYYNMCIGEMYLRKCYLNAIFDEKIAAAWNFKQAYKYITKNHEKHPGFVAHYKSLGILYVIIGSIPEEYAWVVSSFGIKGDINTGISFLEKSLEQKNIFHTESLSFLLMSYLYIIHDPEKAYEGYNNFKLEKKHIVPQFLYSLALQKASKNDESIKLIQTLKPYPYDCPFYHFILADAYLYKLDFENAISEYTTFLKNYKGKNHIKNIFYKLAVAHHLIQKEDLANFYLKKTKEEGNSLFDTDSYAFQNAEKNKFKDDNLLKGQLLFDGGYAEKALVYLNLAEKNQNITEHERIEMLYRKGRSFQKLNKIQEAQHYYNLCIQRSNYDTPLYFGPNACLQSGVLFKSLHNKTEAKKRFNQVLNYKSYPYKKSIKTSAKRELQTL